MKMLITPVNSGYLIVMLNLHGVMDDLMKLLS